MSIIDFNLQPGLFSNQVTEARRFFLSRPTNERAAAVLGGGFERVQADYVVERARLKFLAIEFVVGGRGTASLGGVEFELLPGTMFVYDERSPHKIVTDPDKPLAKYFVDLRSGIGRALLRAAKLPSDRAWHISEPADLQRIFEELLYYGTGSAPHRQAVCDSLLRVILLTAAPAAVPAPRGGLLAFQTYQRCCRTIDAGAAKLRSLDELAGACELDPAYVCRLFRRFDRQTPYERLTRKRMDLAAARLYGSDTPIKHVADGLGFSDQFNFSRTFKGVFGMSPTSFRSAYARSGRPGR